MTYEQGMFRDDKPSYTRIKCFSEEWCKGRKEMITTLIKPPHTKDWEDELDIILNLPLEYWGSNQVDLVRGITFFWPSQNEDLRWGKPNLPPYPKHLPQEEEQYPMRFEQLVWRDMGANGQNVNQTRKDEWESRTWQVFKKEQEEAEVEDAWGNQGIRPVWVETPTYQEENLRSSFQEVRQIKERKNEEIHVENEEEQQKEILNEDQNEEIQDESLPHCKMKRYIRLKNFHQYLEDKKKLPRSRLLLEDDKKQAVEVKKKTDNPKK